MADLKYSLMWDAHTKNMCKGLSLLQQRGEFVDMTLAADGHFVKVHKMVMSLVSPYIKDLISSADCTHPVIFLNKISYDTLASILEYVYTGQVVVTDENLKMFLDACNALHIQGFEELEAMHQSDSKYNDEEENQNTKLLYTTDENIHDYSSILEDANQAADSETDIITEELYLDSDENFPAEDVISEPIKHSAKPMVQYSLSNHGNLQLVLNRYVYNLRYSSRKSGHRRWQCVDGVCKVLKCPARVTTYRDTVFGRNKPHNHPHHDKKILKKVEAGTIFTCLREAENQMHLIRREKDKD